MIRIICAVVMSAVSLANGLVASEGDKNWRIDTAEEWNEAARQIDGLAVNDDLLVTAKKQGIYRSELQRFESKRSAQTLTLTASAQWENWQPTKSKVTPADAQRRTDHAR